MVFTMIPYSVYKYYIFIRRRYLRILRVSYVITYFTMDTFSIVFPRNSFYENVVNLSLRTWNVKTSSWSFFYIVVFSFVSFSCISSRNRSVYFGTRINYCGWSTERESIKRERVLSEFMCILCELSIRSINV